MPDFMPDCTFCQIAAGEIAAHIVLDDDAALAFLDHSPLFFGHVLVVPRGHHVELADLPAHVVGPYFDRVQRMSVAVPAAVGAIGSFVAMNNIVSQSVPHLHCHVVPRRPRDGLRGFFWPRTRYRDVSHMAEVAAAIRGELAR